MPRAIPGYYFDAAKQKYFKVLPNHVAPPGSPYSRENIKKQRAQDSRDKNFRRLDSAGNVRRSRVLRHALAGLVSLDREIGQESRGPRQSNRSAAYGSALEGHTFLELPDPGGLPEIDHKITTFAMDPLTGGIFAGVQEDNHYGLISTVPQKGGNGAWNRIRTVFAPQSTVTSVNVGPTRTLVSTCIGNMNEATINLTKLVSPDQIFDGWLDVGVHVILRPQARTSVWTSTCAPTAGTIAIGTGAGIILIHETPNAFSTTNPPMSTLGEWSNRSIGTPSDVLALEFLSDMTLAAGYRDGCLELVDSRLSESKRTLAIRHPSSVTHIRKVDEHRIVVNGLKSSLRMYDLRFPHPASPSKGYLDPTKSVLAYDHDNDFRLNLGFDVSVETGLIAAAKEDKTVQLFSLHTAEKIDSNIGATPFKEFPRCVRFSPHTREDKLAALLVSTANKIDRFSW